MTTQNATVNGTAQRGFNQLFKKRNRASQVRTEINKQKKKPYFEQNHSEKIFAVIGIWLFPIIAVVLDIFGIAPLLKTMVPVFFAYPIIAAVAIFIEYIHVTLGEPIGENWAKQLEFNKGQIIRYLFFSLASVGLGMCAFYNMFMDHKKQERQANTAIYSARIDSITKVHNGNRELIVRQINGYEAAKMTRDRNMLRPQERELELMLNVQLTKEDSAYKAETKQLKAIFEIDLPVNRLQQFSAAEAAKWFVSFLACLVVAFLTLGCHYMRYNFARETVKEIAKSYNYDEADADKLIEDISTAEHQNVYGEVLMNIAREEKISINFTPQNENQQEQTPNRDETPPPLPTSTPTPTIEQEQATVQTATTPAPLATPQRVVTEQTSPVLAMGRTPVVIGGFLGIRNQYVESQQAQNFQGNQQLAPQTQAVTEAVTPSVTAPPLGPYTSYGVYFYEDITVGTDGLKRCGYCGSTFKTKFVHHRFCADTNHKDLYHAELRLYEVRNPRPASANQA